MKRLRLVLMVLCLLVTLAKQPQIVLEMKGMRHQDDRVYQPFSAKHPGIACGKR